jgi:hypothetical protein
VSSGVSFDNSVCIAFIYVISLHVGSGIQYAVSCIPFHREDRSASPSSLPRIHPESRSSCSYRPSWLSLSLINRVLDVSGEVWYEGEARNLFARSCMPELVGITYDPFTTVVLK